MAKSATISDIARELDISPTTVSFVLNNRDKGISEATRNKIIAKARELGYQKFFQANLRGWLKIAYLVTEISAFNRYTTFFQEVYRHLQQNSLENKFELVVHEFNPNADPDHKFMQSRELKKIGIDIFLTSNQAIAGELIRQDQKVILLQGGRRDDCICIYCDDYSAGSIAAEHAMNNGHRVAGTIFFDNATPRFDGFINTWLGSGGICEEKFRWIIPFDHTVAAEKIAHLTREYKGQIPGFFYCFADNCMFPAIRGFAACGLKVPDDVSLIGTDNLYWGGVSTPAFTTVDLNEELFATQTIQAIKHTASGAAPYQMAVPVRLLPRETVKNLNS